MTQKRVDPWRAIDDLRNEADYVDRPGQRAIVLALADRLERSVDALLRTSI